MTPSSEPVSLPALADQVAVISQGFLALAAELNRAEALATVLAGDFGVGVLDPGRDAVVRAWMADAGPTIIRAVADIARTNDLLSTAL